MQFEPAAAPAALDAKLKDPDAWQQSLPLEVPESLLLNPPITASACA
ncbi:MAG: hypothetical protein LBU32_05155 [Clostridiales bacterium]|jgi:hypothetical protein|nr:hypothetical protein [Clostridiales bacterium]